jgi:hypothetical protein
MICIGVKTATLVLGLSVAAAAQAALEQPATAAAQYQALLQEFQRASSSGAPLTDEERMKFVGRAYKHRNELARRLVALAEKYPADTIALDALLQALWQVNGTPWPVELVGEDDACPRAFAILERDHIRSDKLGATCQRIAYGFRREYERFLRAVLAKNPHAVVQALACLALAQFLKNRQERVDLIQEEPARAKEFADLFGEPYLESLKRQDRVQVDAEAEALLERALRNYAGLKLPDGGTADESATAALYALRRLVVGKEAPDIVGEDQDGKRFKLSDYRGKVVLLDFWSEY